MADSNITSEDKSARLLIQGYTPSTNAGSPKNENERALAHYQAAVDGDQEGDVDKKIAEPVESNYA